MRFLSKLSIILVIFNFIFTEALGNSEIAGKVFQYIDSKNWQEAENLARNSGESALIKVVLSKKFLDTKYSKNNFELAVNFLQSTPHWPCNDKLKTKIEDYLNDKTDKEVIVKWFQSHSPQTPTGHKYYALAAANILKDKTKLIKIIKKGWIYGDFSREEEKNYLKRFGKILQEEDHIRRIDEQLWRKDIKEARRSMFLVSKGYKQAFEAEIASIENSIGKEALFRNIPEKYYTSGLLYNYLNSKKKEVPTSSAVNLFKKVKTGKIHSHQWTKLQLYYAREFIDQKDFLNSYKIASLTLARDAEDIRETEWLAGWLALRFLKKPSIALGHFEKFSKIAEKPISVARGKYWLGRTYEAMGQKAEAHKFYKEANIHPNTFYGQLANVELGENKISLPPTPQAELHHKRSIEKNDIFRATKLLLKYGKQSLAHNYAKEVTKHATADELVWLAQIIKSTNNYYYITDFGKQASQQHIFLRDFAYPTPYKLSNIPVEAALTYSIIRQESVFDAGAISTAKAMGLMQLIKDTACRTAKAINITCDIGRLTRDPQYNIKLGTNQLNMLLNERRGSYILMAASYNTSTCNVNKWLKRFGDPREMKHYREVVDWLELIPFSETRNYVQRILENLQIYRAILNKSNQLHLKADLMR